MQTLAIEIQDIDGKWHFLDLDENTSITIKEKSPFFSDETIPSLASYTATLPASPKNQVIFQNANIIAAGYKTRWASPYNARLYLQGVLWRELVLNLKKGITNKRLPFVLESTHRYAFNGVNVRDMAWESFNIGADTAAIIAHMKATALSSYPSYSHVFFPLF